MPKRFILIGIVALAIIVFSKVSPLGKGETFSARGNYVNDTYHFSLDLPEGFQVGTIPGADETGETLLVQGKTDQFQIYIAPFDEDVAITAERIQQDIPAMVIKNPHQIKLAANGQSLMALTFDGDDDSFGPTHEAWFTHAGNIYQLKSKADFGISLDQILSTWKFQ